MRDSTFFLDGKSAKEHGIHLQSPIEFSDAQPIFDVQTIPGRNGDLVFETGAYANRSADCECYIMQNSAYDAVGVANKFLLSKRGYRRLQASDDPTHYWMALVKNGVSIDNRKNKLIPFSLSFNCKPQRFIVDGDMPINVENGGIVFNRYGFEALPLIRIFGNGEGSLRINEIDVAVKSNNGLLVLDSETQNAYNGFANQNSQINAPVFPVLESGENAVYFFGGIERVEIIPRWWEL